MSAPFISVVVTVFNKEAYLPATIRSLTEQAGDLDIEYIFVDDVSPDRSVEVVEQATKGLPQVQIIKNTENRGPSARINQGVQAANGKYVFCFDSDDILAGNALKVMSDALEKNEADAIYGQWKKTDETGEALLGKTIADDAVIDVSDHPLQMVLTGRFLRMQFMARRDTYLQAGGADERIFIQDESIPLRLAAHAKRWLKLNDTVMYVPHIEGALSRNVSQLNHDRFLAHYYLLKEQPNLPAIEQELLYKRAVSAGWKQVRYEKGVFAMLHPFFFGYLKSKQAGATVDMALIERMAKHIHNLTEVRRAKP